MQYVGYVCMGTTSASTKNDIRICGDDECNTRLSRYNEYDFCALHQPMITPRTRGRIID